GAIAGLASSLLAYFGRLFAASLPTHVLFLRDFLRVGAIVLAVGAGAAFLTGMNMVSLTVPEGSTTRVKSKPENQAPSSKPGNQAPSSKPQPERLSPTGNHVRLASVIGILPLNVFFRLQPSGSGQLSLREVSQKLAALGFLNERAKPYAAKSIASMV